MFFRNFNQYQNSISLIQFPRKNIFSDTFQNKLFSFFWLWKIDKHISLWNFANKSGVKFFDRKIKCLISVKLIEVAPFKTGKKMGNFVFSTYLPDRKAKNKTFIWTKKENQCITSLAFSSAMNWKWIQMLYSIEYTTNNVSKPEKRTMTSSWKIRVLCKIQQTEHFPALCRLIFNNVAALLETQMNPASNWHCRKLHARQKLKALKIKLLQ